LGVPLSANRIYPVVKKYLQTNLKINSEIRKEGKMEEATEKKGIENIAEKYKCKITVLRKTFNEELYKKYPYGAASACGRLEEG
jgi:ribosomal protein L31E